LGRGFEVLKSFKDLEVWRRAHGVVLGYSIPSNIAEGFSRRSTKELLQFLTLANGSLEGVTH
jgi:four helix bundle protein